MNGVINSYGLAGMGLLQVHDWAQVFTESQEGETTAS
jgi:hypothetical protein